MDKLRAIVTAIALCALLVSCGKKDEDAVPKQRTAFETFLGKDSFEGYVEQNGVYVFVSNKDRVGYETASVAVAGDLVSFWFEGYVFSTSNEGKGGLIYTNRQEVMSGVEGLNHEMWSKAPFETRVGSGALIKGLDRGLVNCREGDSLSLFITSDFGYGEKPFMILPKDTPLMFMLEIKSVTNQ